VTSLVRLPWREGTMTYSATAAPLTGTTWPSVTATLAVDATADIATLYAGSNKKFPSVGPWTMVQAYWDAASVMALVAGAGLSASAAMVLAAGLALPSIAMTTIGFIDFLTWVQEKHLSTAAEAAIVLQAATLYVALVSVAMVSVFLPLPYAILTQIACSVLGTVMFLGVLPIEVDLCVSGMR
jgi:hypothetical protein